MWRTTLTQTFKPQTHSHDRDGHGMTASDRAILSAKWHALGGLRYTRESLNVEPYGLTIRPAWHRLPIDGASANVRAEALARTPAHELRQDMREEVRGLNVSPW